MAISLPNPGMLKAIFDAIFNGGKSMKGGKNLQDQIADAPVAALKAPLITGWKNAAGKPYSTSIAQQLAFNAQGIARMEAQLSAIESLLSQVAQAANSGVDVKIDYDKIKAMMPEAPTYTLTPTEGAK